MRLVNCEYDLHFDLKENIVNKLTIENREAFRNIIQSLWKQSNGLEGSFILSDEKQSYKFDKETALIINPFSVNCNDKKILSNIYGEISECATNDNYEMVCEINGQILNFLDNILSLVPYPLTIETELDITGLLKLFCVEIDDDSISLLDQLTNYIKTAGKVLKKKVFVFVNLATFFNDAEIQQLYESCFYEKVHVFCVEGICSKQLPCEKCCIIDDDLCIINT